MSVKTINITIDELIEKFKKYNNNEKDNTNAQVTHENNIPETAQVDAEITDKGGQKEKEGITKKAYTQGIAPICAYSTNGGNSHRRLLYPRPFLPAQ